MTSDVNEKHVGTASARKTSRLNAYLRLGKLDVYDYYLGILIVASAVLLPPMVMASGTIPMLLLFLVGEIGTLVAMVTLDDVTGYHDGSDIANYGPNEPLRKKLRKPLVAGTLTTPQAMRFAAAAATVGALGWVGAVALAPHRPLWTVILLVCTYVLALQYSYGIKLSYRGFQETFLAALGVALVFAPYGLATGQFSGFLLVQAVLFGLGPVLFGVYSNTNDIEGDRSVSRPTVAALVSPRGNALFIGALSAGEFLLGAVASLTGVAPWWFVLLVLPATALRVRQYYLGFGVNDIMRARKLGFTVHRVYVALLIAANILVSLEALG